MPHTEAWGPAARRLPTGTGGEPGSRQTPRTRRGPGASHAGNLCAPCRVAQGPLTGWLFPSKVFICSPGFPLSTFKAKGHRAGILSGLSRPLSAALGTPPDRNQDPSPEAQGDEQEGPAGRGCAPGRAVIYSGTR